MFLGRRGRVHIKKADQCETGLQIFDLLELSHQEQKLKRLCQQSLETLRRWEDGLPVHISSAISSSVRRQTAELRRSARLNLHAYRKKRRDRRELFDCYIDNLSNAGSIKRLVS